MQKILTILTIGLFAFGALAGCVGSDDENDVVVPIEEEEEIPEETNETIEPEPKTNPYHNEYDESMMLMDVLDHSFPVKQNATKLLVVISATCTIPDPSGNTGLYVYLYTPASEEYLEAWTVNGELTIEMTSSEIKEQGYGDWNIQFIAADPSITVQTTIDVTY